MMAESLSSERLLLQLAEYLAGEFDNRQQSLADPTWFLHLRVWNRPLPTHIFSEGYGFFIEQVNVATGNPPYRQRILHLTHRGKQLIGQYYALEAPAAFAGSAIDPDRLQGLRRTDLIDLPTCTLDISVDPTTGQFRGRLPENTLCCITVDGQPSYISLAFDISRSVQPPELGETTPSIALTVYDRGVDAATGATTWGPRMGPFQLKKQAAFPLFKS
jgi:hypothetical protein